MAKIKDFMKNMNSIFTSIADKPVEVKHESFNNVEFRGNIRQH